MMRTMNAADRSGQRGFTLTETMVTMGLVSIVFLAFVAFSIQALRTFSWMTATNVAHQQARQGVQNMLQGIHNSPSPLLLVNVNQEAAPMNGTFWGVVYQRLIGGPYEAVGGLAAGDTTVSLRLGSALTPQVGQLIILPGSNTLYEIQAVNGLSSGVRTVTISPAISGNDALTIGAGYDSTDSGSGGQQAVGVYLSERSAFLVRRENPGDANSDLELRHYPTLLRWTNNSAGVLVGTDTLGNPIYYAPLIGGSAASAIDNPNAYRVVSRGLRAVTDSGSGSLIGPFSDPSAPGVVNRQAVAAVQLSLQDGKVSELINDSQSRHHMNATTIFLNSDIPQKHIVTTRQ